MIVLTRVQARSSQESNIVHQQYINCEHDVDDHRCISNADTFEERIYENDVHRGRSFYATTPPRVIY